MSDQEDRELRELKAMVYPIAATAGGARAANFEWDEVYSKAIETALISLAPLLQAKRERDELAEREKTLGFIGAEAMRNLVAAEERARKAEEALGNCGLPYASLESNRLEQQRRAEAAEEGKRRAEEERDQANVSLRWMGGLLKTSEAQLAQANSRVRQCCEERDFAQRACHSANARVEELSGDIRTVMFISAVTEAKAYHPSWSPAEREAWDRLMSGQAALSRPEAECGGCGHFRSDCRCQARPEARTPEGKD